MANGNITEEQIGRLVGVGSVLFHFLKEEGNGGARGLTYVVGLEKGASPLPEYTCGALMTLAAMTVTSAEKMVSKCNLWPLYSNRLHDRSIDLFLFEYFMLMFFRYVADSHAVFLNLKVK